VAALSAITLALSGLSVTSFNELTPEAAAATLTGGIRDKSGAVEKDKQKASDLPAGSCVVEGGAPSGSQAGFTWQNLEPSATSPSKTTWGLSLAFDNSQDRTFADWSFSNSGLMGGVLNAGSVASIDAGKDFPVSPPLPVTAKADESIAITASRNQRNLNLYADLTEDEVKQFAEAGKDDPVRYAWKGNYTKDPTTQSLRATEGTNTQFTATVNPWPSENIECNPITVSWESFEKHVIVPGEETKVGHINVPAVA
ncbi:adhesin domain containing protein, partial [Corynebacterium hesseae]|uniref:adhesin domain containing protein n=1 Tax=Corynebacterium hesseae TaxID=2913502 RepID=UPI00373E70F9